MTDETIKVTEPKAKKPKVVTLPHFENLRELKVWLMKLSEEEREAVSDKVNKIAPTLQ